MTTSFQWHHLSSNLYDLHWGNYCPLLYPYWASTVSQHHTEMENREEGRRAEERTGQEERRGEERRGQNRRREEKRREERGEKERRG